MENGKGSGNGYSGIRAVVAAAAMGSAAGAGAEGEVSLLSRALGGSKGMGRVVWRGLGVPRSFQGRCWQKIR